MFNQTKEKKSYTCTSTKRCLFNSHTPRARTYKRKFRINMDNQIVLLGKSVRFYRNCGAASVGSRNECLVNV